MMWFLMLVFTFCSSFAAEPFDPGGRPDFDTALHALEACGPELVVLRQRQLVPTAHLKPSPVAYTRRVWQPRTC